MTGQSMGDRALAERYSVAEFVAYLHRVGYHEIAERASSDRQIIVLGREPGDVIPRSEAESLAEALERIARGLPHWAATADAQQIADVALAEYRSRHPSETP